MPKFYFDKEKISQMTKNKTKQNTLQCSLEAIDYIPVNFDLQQYLYML